MPEHSKACQNKGCPYYLFGKECEAAEGCAGYEGISYEKGTEKKFKVISGGKIVEAREFRCCMCPQINDKRRICPAGPGKPEETLCDFTVIWTDARGWKYKVMGDLAGTFKGRYQDDKHNGDTGWKGMRQMERRETFDQAQEDLNRYAKQKGWKLAGEMG